MIESTAKSLGNLCTQRSEYYGEWMKLPALLAAAFVTTPLTTLTTLSTTTASAAPTPHPRPVVKCEFTPTPENPAAKPVRIPSANARAKGTVDVYFVTN